MKPKVLPRKPLKASKRSLQRSKPKKRRKSSLRVLKAKLEANLKERVIKLYGRDCYTCEAQNLQGANCQLGHVPWPRSILSTPCKYDIRFVRIQCFRCNIHHGGMGAKALERMQMESIDTVSMWIYNQETRGKTYGPKYFEQQLQLLQ